MKRCVEEHTVPSFGVIPVGSLWEDDSPYVVEAGKFVDADAPDPKPKPARNKKGDS